LSASFFFVSLVGDSTIFILIFLDIHSYIPFQMVGLSRTLFHGMQPNVKYPYYLSFFFFFF